MKTVRKIAHKLLVLSRCLACHIGLGLMFEEAIRNPYDPGNMEMFEGMAEAMRQQEREMMLAFGIPPHRLRRIPNRASTEEFGEDQ